MVIGRAALQGPAEVVWPCAQRFEPRVQVQPRPGTTLEDGATVLPYISCVPGYQEAALCDGFVIVACDGVWDEMSSAEAVQVVSELLAQSDGTADIAAQFIEAVLAKVRLPPPDRFPPSAAHHKADVRSLATVRWSPAAGWATGRSASSPWRS